MLTGPAHKVPDSPSAALMLETNDALAVARYYMSLETLPRITQEAHVKRLAVAA